MTWQDQQGNGGGVRSGEHGSGNGASRARPASRSKQDSARGSAGQLFDQLGETMQNTTALAGNLGSMVRQNPWPMALIGAAVAWLALSGSSGGRRSGGSGGSYPGSRSQAYGDSGGNGGMGASSHSGSSTLGNYGGRLQEQAGRLKESAGHVYEQQPLVLAAVGVAVGAVLGTVLPVTRREEQVLGPSRDEMLTRAVEAGRETLRQAEAGVSAAVEAGKQELSGESKKEGSGDRRSDGKPGAKATGSGPDHLS